MNPRPKIPQIHDDYEVSQYDRDLNSDLYKELLELRKEMNLRISSTYTPTLTNTTNIAASTAYACQYTQVGKVVTVSGMCDVDPTAAAPTATRLDITLPIASTFSNAWECCGTGASAVNEACRVAAGTGKARMEWNATDATNHTFTFQFTYQIL